MRRNLARVSTTIHCAVYTRSAPTGNPDVPPGPDFDFLPFVLDFSHLRSPQNLRAKEYPAYYGTRVYGTKEPVCQNFGALFIRAVTKRGTANTVHGTW